MSQQPGTMRWAHATKAGQLGSIYQIAFFVSYCRQTYSS